MTQNTLTKTPSNYTGIGETYRKYRVGYSDAVLNLLIEHTKIKKKNGIFVDIGAGTGIWTKQVADKDIRCIAIEPNDDMRENGLIYTKENKDIEWRKGTAEETGLKDNYADWVTMASSFHWTIPEKSLPEFYRILKNNGYLTLIWNPLLKKGDEIQEKIESIIKKFVPEFSRGEREKDNFGEIIASTGYFDDVIEIRHIHYVDISTENYINAWKAANHLRNTAGEERFNLILSKIKELLKNKDTLLVPYLTKSWTARKVINKRQ